MTAPGGRLNRIPSLPGLESGGVHGCADERLLRGAAVQAIGKHQQADTCMLSSLPGPMGCFRQDLRGVMVKFDCGWLRHCLLSSPWRCQAA